MTALDVFSKNSMLPPGTMSEFDSYTDSEASSRAELFGWYCFICKKWAISGIQLESSFLDYDSVTVVDKDGSRWLRCDNCALSCHVKCLNKNRLCWLVPEVTWQVLESNGRFTCC